ncbi:MAG: hypothetical protein SX243_03225 [Acidobacteriota bacterium]|nr:hypothetical protein [Acidobacteriota bacterium]
MHDSHTGSSTEVFDGEISYKQIIQFMAYLLVLTAITFVLMWWMLEGMRSRLASNDPAPSPIPEANQPPESPGPQLQFFPPVADIDRLHAWEDERLESYAWENEEAGVARIPIERAMEIMAERGLPRAGEVDDVSAELFGDRAEMATEVSGAGASSSDEGDAAPESGGSAQ